MLFTAFLRLTRAVAGVALVLSAPTSLVACSCVGSASVCGAFAGEDGIVFTGRVEALEPDTSAMAERFAQLFPGLEDLDDLEDDTSPDKLAKAKALYAGVFTGSMAAEIVNAEDWRGFLAAVEKAMDEGVRARFQIHERYKGLAADARSVEVRTSISGCGVTFIKGETYLVYAGKNGTGEFSTGACSRTRRLSDAGDDLVYLHFVRRGGDAVSRVYGFTTSNELDLRTPRYWDHVNGPIPNLVVQLKSPNTTLFSTTNTEGRFVFDGLTSGVYEVMVSRTELEQPIVEPRRIEVGLRACRSEVFFVPKKALERR